MRLSAYLNRSNIPLQLLCLLCLGLTLFAFTKGAYYVLALPIIAGLFLLLVFVPKSIPYIFILTNFYGAIVYEKAIRIGVTITDLFFIIVILAFIGSFLPYSPHNNHFNKRSNVFYLLMLLFFVAIISFLVNITLYPRTFMAISIWYLIRLSHLPLAFFIFSNITLDFRRIERFISLCIGLALIQFPVVLFQYYRLMHTAFDESRFEITGTLTFHHAYLGTFMLIPLFLVLYRFLVANRNSRKVLYCAICIVFICIIIFSGSRGALFGIACAGLLFFMMNFELNKQYVVSTLVILGAMIVLYFATPLQSIIMLTFQSSETTLLDISSMGRFVIWKSSFEHFLGSDIIRKLFGNGIGAFNSIQHDIVIFSGAKTTTGAHNNFLHVLIEIGIVGLSIYLLLFYTILKKLYKAFTNPLAKMFFFLTIALLVSSLTQETFWFQKSFATFWLFYTFFLAIVFQTIRRTERA